MIFFRHVKEMFWDFELSMEIVSHSMMIFALEFSSVCPSLPFSLFRFFFFSSLFYFFCVFLSFFIFSFTMICSFAFFPWCYFEVMLVWTKNEQKKSCLFWIKRNSLTWFHDLFVCIFYKSIPLPIPSFISYYP